jgi:DNA-binding MarR family transcriptional regulator
VPDVGKPSRRGLLLRRESAVSELSLGPVVERTKMINGDSDFLKPGKLLKILHALIEIGNQPDLSQHELARRISLSSSQVNNYIKELETSGMIDMEGTTNRTIRYLLTPRGEREKASMLIDYSVDVIQLYSRVKMEFRKKLQKMSQTGFTRAVLFGAAETGEVVLAASKDTALRIVGVSDNDPRKHGTRFGDFTVIPPSQIETLGPDGIIITSFAQMNQIRDSLGFLEEKGIRVQSLAEP